MFPSLSVWPTTHISFTNIAVTDNFGLKLIILFGLKSIFRITDVIVTDNFLVSNPFMFGLNSIPYL